MAPSTIRSLIRPTLSCALLVLAFSQGASAQERWPQFRGPASDNVAKVKGPLPTVWSEQQNIMWKLPTELRGWSSPAVWGDVALMTEATSDGLEMYAMAVDIRDGQLMWRKKIFVNDKVGETHNMNSFASPSPVTDGEHVWVNFGSYGTACLRVSDGSVVWERRDLPCEHYRGPGSSPYMDSEGRLFLHYDGFDLQYIVALAADDGRTLWKKDRDIDYGTDNGDQKKAFCTPTVITVDGKPQLISATSKAVIAYEPATGEEIWRVLYDEFSATGQPFYDGRVLYVNSGFGKAHLLAIDPRGHGDVSDSHVHWIAAKGIGSKPSQVLHDGLIFNVHDAGVASCLDASDGSEVWSERLGGQFSASPLIADGKLYMFDHDGSGFVIEPGREYKLIAKNKLDDGCMASPVPLSDSLLIRTRTALYRIKP